MSSFEKKLKSFVFFHLGSDAQLGIESDSDHIQVSLSHQRIHPCDFSLSLQEASELATDEEAFEDYMFSLLTRHRSSRTEL